MTVGTQEKKGFNTNMLSLLIGLIAMLVIWFLPTPDGLPVAGQRVGGILVFAVIVWMTECISYPVSAMVITVFMSFGLGLAPDVTKPTSMLGTSKALSIALSGFSNTAWALVAAALFLAVAMQVTGLDKRIALVVLSGIGTKTNRILIGVIFVGFLLSFFVPSTTARVSCMVPIVLGVIQALGLKKGSKFAGALMIAVAQADSLWNVGIKTAAAQNMVAVSFIKQTLGTDISWMEWFIAAAPYAAVMSVVLYYVMMKLMKPEFDEVPGGAAKMKEMLRELGPMTISEKKLMAISIGLLFFWVTEGKWHNFDTSTTTITGIALMFLPGIGIMNWKEAVPKINWGTIVMFGIGISLGSALLSTKMATWVAKVVVSSLGIQTMPALMILAVLAMFLIVIHLGFASAVGLASAMIPIIISVLQEVQTPGINILGMTMLLQYVVCFGFILPVNAPQNMIAYGTETFSVKEFVWTGIPLTVIGYALFLIFSMTYWHWLGYV